MKKESYENDTSQTKIKSNKVKIFESPFYFRDLNASAASVEDANALLDTLDAIAQTLAVESSKARDLIKLGM